MQLSRSFATLVTLSVLVAHHSTVARPISDHAQPQSDLASRSGNAPGTETIPASDPSRAASQAAASTAAPSEDQQRQQLMMMISHGSGGPIKLQTEPPREEKKKAGESKADKKGQSKGQSEKGGAKSKDAGEKKLTKGKSRHRGMDTDTDTQSGKGKGKDRSSTAATTAKGKSKGEDRGQDDKHGKAKATTKGMSKSHDDVKKAGEGKKGMNGLVQPTAKGAGETKLPKAAVAGSAAGAGAATAAAAAAPLANLADDAAEDADDEAEPEADEAPSRPSSANFPATVFNSTSSLASNHSASANTTSSSSSTQLPSTASTASNATAQAQAPASANLSSLRGALIPRTRFCAQPENKNKTIDTLTLALVQKEKKRLTKLRESREDKGRSLTNAQILADAKKSVDVVFHVVHDGKEGNLTSSQINQQVDVLNSDYSKYGFQFALNATNYVDNADWFRNVAPGSTQQDELKNANHRGDEKVLNLYSVNFSNNLLGYATFPWDARDALKQDGVVFQYSTVPGGNELGYNMGKTATHEVGHWLGLYHVFQGGCAAPGDLVDDTPPQSQATSGCPARQDSCPGGGVDSIHNYMDYSNDECLTEFTDGQAVRMAAIVTEYRGL
ncbi:uncharacterized protein PFL1_06368 [Pseudozyma flocculosa PF-1]|uniref:Peptidase M43 pregnancy-associated plasma-A domain-containing protein n=2 Tax=Pseudozyma flocculosa TaxID=84751 RepID=A0A5C3F858_9BASI|nr:uncharacterized protein PFL1_06368 [Pseudozyma flocculosa PF-1]EPQ26160.1 hypothetical protein PFL1_06368 [Pseudozyma flocculosa PF-1]SPO40410.1 uncharacterized protein PSFLO_05892 [Pseudozyma flocculosa]